MTGRSLAATMRTLRMDGMATLKDEPPRACGGLLEIRVGAVPSAAAGGAGGGGHGCADRESTGGASIQHSASATIAARARRLLPFHVCATSQHSPPKRNQRWQAHRITGRPSQSASGAWAACAAWPASRSPSIGVGLSTHHLHPLKCLPVISALRLRRPMSIHRHRHRQRSDRLPNG